MNNWKFARLFLENDNIDVDIETDSKGNPVRLVEKDNQGR